MYEAEASHLMPIILNIPDDPVERNHWLEKVLMGLNLGEIVADLSAVAVDVEQTINLQDIIGDSLDQVLEQGLSLLTLTQIQQLLQSPHLLLKLQTEVLTYGDSYWRDLHFSDEHQQLSQNGWKTFQATLKQQGVKTVSEEPSIQAEKELSSQSSTTSSQLRRGLLFSLLGIAAAVVIGVLLIPKPAPTHGWGFDRPGALTADVSAPQYLNGLANSAGEWFKKRPQNKTDIKKRLQQFRHGCDTLIKAPHPQLSEVDRKWLVKKCKVWASLIDEHIVAVDQGGKVSEVLSNADITVNKLIAALQKRASIAS